MSPVYLRMSFQNFLGVAGGKYDAVKGFSEQKPICTKSFMVYCFFVFYLPQRLPQCLPE
jgi:hypothetical protein